MAVEPTVSGGSDLEALSLWICRLRSKRRAQSWITVTLPPEACSAVSRHEASKGIQIHRDGGVWWAAVYGVAQSQTRLKRLSSSSILAWRIPWINICPTNRLHLFFSPSAVQ